MYFFECRIIKLLRETALFYCRAGRKHLSEIFKRDLRPEKKPPVKNANGTKITGATSPYSHTALTNGTTYYYIVTAVNLGGESAASTQVSAMPLTPASFGAATNYTVGTYPQKVEIGDLNGDGKPDLAVGNITSNTVSILLNTTI